MKIAFVYPKFDRHADSHPELRDVVDAREYLGPPSLGIASVAAATPDEHEVMFIDDRVTPFDPDEIDADVYALSFFTPAATRALEIGADLRRRDKTVVMGGIFPTQMPDVCASSCSSVVVGEGEGVWPRLLADLQADALVPRYAGDVPDLDACRPPRIDLYLDAEQDGLRPDDYPLQISRGCPFKCDACVLPRHMGRQMRFHSSTNLCHTMTTLAEAGKLISLTEDTSVTFAGGARKRFRRFLHLVHNLQEDGVDLRFSYLGISMPMILHLDPDLLEDLRRTGLGRFYLVGGFDPITRKAFGQGDRVAMDKAERAIARCQEHGIEPYVSFLVGNPTDDDRVFERMLSFARRTGLTLAEFAIATPYPGTPIWERYQAEGRITDYTWKRYNDANVVFEPHQMSAETLTQGYLHLWTEFYRQRDAAAPRELAVQF